MAASENGWIISKKNFLRERDRETETETQRETERDRERQRETERDRERENKILFNNQWVFDIFVLIPVIIMQYLFDSVWYVLRVWVSVKLKYRHQSSNYLESIIYYYISK